MRCPPQPGMSQHSPHTMSSPPTSTTSTKAATLSQLKRNERRSSSFPSIAALRFFCKKPATEPPSPREPYEVAPGIWNTDASAKVFGYDDTTDDEPTTKFRKQSVKSKKRDQIDLPLSKPVPIRVGRKEMKMVSCEDRLTERGVRTFPSIFFPVGD